MIATFKCSRAAVYHNTHRLTPAQIKAETGCSHLINGYFFDNDPESGTYMAPFGWLVIAGEDIARDAYNDWGFACGPSGAPRMSTDRSYSYLSGVPILKNGQKLKRNLTPDVARRAERSAVAWLADGRVLLWCDKEKLTRDELQDKLMRLGVVDALMMDGGGSVQGSFPGWMLTPGRVVPTLLLFWAEDETPEEETTMTENELRQKVVNKAKSYLGCKESNGSHKKIIDLYNSHKPLARGYAVRYTDEWCATFVSAVSIACGLTGIMPTECSCSKMIELHKDLGRWQENDAYTPKPGDIIMYDWEDNGRGDNTGMPNHTGIVVAVNGTSLTIIEGNKNEAVAYRAMTVNGKYIRGYCLPNYASKATGATTVSAEKSVTVSLPQLENGSKGAAVRSLQQLLTAKGYSTQGIDGAFGKNTKKALVNYQSAMNLTADGVCGKDTWTTLLTK